MNPAFPPCPSHTHWKTLYRAAIFERNRAAILARILEAELAVLGSHASSYAAAARVKNETRWTMPCMPCAHIKPPGSGTKLRSPTCDAAHTCGYSSSQMTAEFGVILGL